MHNIVIDYNSHGLFTVQVLVAVGSVHEEKGLRGYTHLLEHMMFKSKRNTTVEALLKSLNDLGGVFNATTSKDCTTFFIKTTSQKWRESLEIMHKIVFEPNFVDSDLDKEQRVVIEELLMSKDDLAEIVVNAAYKMFLPKSNPYWQPVIGKSGDIKKATSAKLQEYYNKHFTDPHNILIYISCPPALHSQVRPLAVGLFRKQMGKFDARALPAWPGVNGPGPIVKVIRESSVAQAMTCVIFEAFPFADRKSVVLEYMWEVLLGNLNSLLMMELREKRGYVYSMSSFTDAYTHGGVTGMYFTSSHNNLGDIVRYLFKILTKLKKDGLSEDTLQYTKANYINRVKYHLANFNYKEERKLWRYFYNADWTEKDIAKQILRLTNEDLKDVAKTVFSPTKVAVVSYGNYEDAQGEEAKVKQALSMF